MVVLSKLLKLDRFPHPLTFSGDLKLVSAWLGLSGASGKFGCPYCTAQREQLGDRKKGKWFGGQPRTFQRLLEQNKKFREKKSNKAMDFESCKHPPIRISHGHDHLPLIHEFAPGPLHCMLLGRYIVLFVNNIFSRYCNLITNRVHPSICTHICIVFKFYCDFFHHLLTGTKRYLILMIHNVV